MSPLASSAPVTSKEKKMTYFQNSRRRHLMAMARWGLDGGSGGPSAYASPGECRRRRHPCQRAEEPPGGRRCAPGLSEARGGLHRPPEASLRRLLLENLHEEVSPAVLLPACLTGATARAQPLPI